MSFLRSFCLGCLAAVFGYVGIAYAQIPRPQVAVDAGTLAGTVDTDGVRVFKGIPFAAPPIGNL